MLNSTWQKKFIDIGKQICLRRSMQKAPMALSSSPKLIIVKTGNHFNGYISNFTHKAPKKICMFEVT